MKPGDLQNLRVSFLITARWYPKIPPPKKSEKEPQNIEVYTMLVLYFSGNMHTT
jgi:hypothetical protein